MKPLGIALLGLLLFSAGNRSLHSHRGGSVAAAQQRLDKGSIRIITCIEPVLKAEQLRVATDSVHWLDWQSGEPVSLENAEVRQVVAFGGEKGRRPVCLQGCWPVGVWDCSSVLEGV